MSTKIKPQKSIGELKERLTSKYTWIVGPFGTTLKNQGFDTDGPLGGSAALLDNDSYRNNVVQLYRDYFRAIADSGKEVTGILAPTNTFGVRLNGIEQAINDKKTYEQYPKIRKVLDNNNNIEIVQLITDSAVDVVAEAVAEEELGELVIPALNSGPAFDPYVVGTPPMTEKEAESFHELKLASLRKSGQKYGVILTHFETIGKFSEALGMTNKTRDLDLPFIMSLYLNPTDSMLFNEHYYIGDVMERISQNPAFVAGGLNCRHPASAVKALEGIKERNPSTLKHFNIFYGNTSTLEAEELNRRPTIKRTEGKTFGTKLSDLARDFESLTILGTCCGGDPEYYREFLKHFNLKG